MMNTQLGRNTKNTIYFPIDPNILNKTFVHLSYNTTKNIKIPKDYKSIMRDLIKNSIFLAHTTAKEPIKIVSKFATKSSCGFDNITKKAIKQIMPHVTNPLSIIFKICLS